MSVAHRILACTAILEDKSLDLLVAFGGSVHNFLQCEPVLVLSGFRTIGPTAAILDRGGGVSLLVSPAWDTARAKRLAAPGTDVTGTDDLPAALAAFVSGSKVPGDRIGCAGMEMLPSGIASRLSEAMGGCALDVEQSVREVDQVRTPEEFESARRATEIGEQGYQRLLETARAGMAEFELAADLLCYMKELGAEDNFLLVNSSQHGIGVGPPGRRILEEGDLILAEITPSFGWQFSQVCRTVSVGRPSSVTLEKYEVLRTAMKVGMVAAVPGTTVAQSAKAMNKVIADAGYGDYCRPPYMRVRGHGLGNLSDLPGDIGSDNDIVYAENMFFVMHPNQYLPETGYMMCGEPVRITATGADPLTRSMATLDWVKP